MSVVTLPIPKEVTPAAGRPRRSDLLARAAVRSRLDRLKAGQLEIHDSLGVTKVGNGPGTVHRIDVHDPRFYRLVLTHGSLGVAESYINKWWTCDDLTALLSLFVREIRLARSLQGPAGLAATLASRVAHASRRNTHAGSKRNITEHYDLGNDFFELMLDETMTYSCGIFAKPTTSLANAQHEKYDRICRTLELGAGDHVLEIGTGWGGFAFHAARNYGCRVTTTTISDNQHQYASSLFESHGLTERVRLLKSDYRDLGGTFDALVSIEMIEAVGDAFLGDYFRVCVDRLKDDGRMMLQAISMPDEGYDAYLRRVDFIQKYVFPGSCCPSIGAINRAASTAGLKLARLDDLTPHYARTLSHWRSRFLANADQARALGYSDRFLRLWEFYLSYCEAGFAERYVASSQILLAKNGYRGESLPDLTGNCG